MDNNPNNVNYMEELDLREQDRVIPNYKEWKKRNPDPYPLVDEFLESNPELLNTGRATPTLWSKLSEDLKSRPGGSRDFTADFESQSLFELMTQRVGEKISSLMKIFSIDKMGYDESSFEQKEVEWDIQAAQAHSVENEIPASSASESESYSFVDELKKRDAEQVIPNHETWKQNNPDAYPLIASYLEANPDKLYTNDATGSQWTELSENLKNRPGGSTSYQADFFDPSLQDLLSNHVGNELAADVKSFAIQSLGYKESDFEPKEVEWDLSSPVSDKPEKPSSPESEAKKDSALFDLVNNGVIKIPSVKASEPESTLSIDDDIYKKERDREKALDAYEQWNNDHAHQNVDYLVTRFLDANPESIYIDGESAYYGANPTGWSELAHGLAEREGGSRDFQADMIHNSLDSYIESYVGHEGAARLKTFAMEELGYAESDFSDKLDTQENNKKERRHKSSELSY